MSDAATTLLLLDDDDNGNKDAFKQKTYLAPLVHHLICKVGTRTSGSLKEPCLLPNGLINWEALDRNALQEDIDSWDTKKDFIDIVSRLALLCLDIHEHVMALSLFELEETYSEWLQWTGCPGVFLEGFKLLKEDDDRGPSISLLMTTSALERALGDVYLLKNKPCPSLLKDLLVTQELNSFFGWHSLFCLRVLMGPPTSLNLRNILWHGFASPGEIPARYSTFLLVLTASLGYKLHSEDILPSTIPHRTQIDFQKHVTFLKTKFPVLLPIDINSLSTIVCDRRLICKSHVSMWEQAAHYYKIERYNLCVMILCPLLEHLIRLIFAKANRCPERLLTAESTVLFTTFDEMLCAELNDGNPNLLIPAISEPFMDLLMDLLIHPDGPRLRDRISHGEVDIHGVPRELASFTLCVLLACSMKAACLAPQSSLQLPLLIEILDCASSYTSVFHPVAACRCLIHSLAPCLSDWSFLPRPTPQDLDYSPWESGPLDREAEERTKDEHLVLMVLKHSRCFSKDDEGCITECVIHPFHCMDPLACHLDSLHLQTLFRPRKELEVAGLLHHITSECLKVHDQIRCLATTRFSQWQGKELRSRQRVNYQRFLNRLPRIGTGLRFVVLLLSSHLSLINQVSSLDKHFVPTIKFLKAVLQYAENLTSLTSIEKNKWEESAQLTEDFLDRVRKHYSKMNKQNRGMLIHCLINSLILHRLNTGTTRFQLAKA